MTIDKSGHLTEDSIINLLSNILDPEDARETISHLKTCPPCEERFQDLAKDHEYLAASEQPQMVNDSIVLKNTVQRDNSLGRPWRRVVSLVAAGSAAA